MKDQTHTWILGRRGKALTQANAAGSFSNRNTIDHDVLITQVRMKLESLNLAKTWVSEFQMKSEVFRKNHYRSAKERLIPDGILVEPISGLARAIAIELELTRKSQLRYRRIFDQYAGKSSLAYIWYFVPSVKDAQMINKCSQQSLRFGESRKLWFSLLGDFLENEDPKVFSVQNRKWMKLSELGFDHFKISEKAPTQGVSRQEGKNLVSQTESKPAGSFTNSPGETALRAGPSAPDPSPSTMERGQELQAKTEDESSELVNDVEFKKCG